MPVNNMIADQADEMRQWRHFLHSHPELAFEEHQTADFIAGKLTEFGIEGASRHGKNRRYWRYSG
jgi:hippurate hydrolase